MTTDLYGRIYMSGGCIIQIVVGTFAGLALCGCIVEAKGGYDGRAGLASIPARASAAALSSGDMLASIAATSIPCAFLPQLMS